MANKILLTFMLCLLIVTCRVRFYNGEVWEVTRWMGCELAEVVHESEKFDGNGKRQLHGLRFWDMREGRAVGKAQLQWKYSGG